MKLLTTPTSSIFQTVIPGLSIMLNLYGTEETVDVQNSEKKITKNSISETVKKVLLKFKKTFLL